MSDSNPTDRHDDESLLGWIIDEFTDRLNRGEQPDVSAYADSHPQLATVLQQILPPLVAMRDASSPLEIVGLPSTGSTLSPGTQLDAYHIVREIGRGGMAVVYQAVHSRLGRRVALKVMNGPVQNESLVRRFAREARAAAVLHHTNIVPVYEAGESDGVLFIAMQFIDGQSLDDVVRCLTGDPRLAATTPGPGEPTTSVAPLIGEPPGANEVQAPELDSPQAAHDPGLEDRAADTEPLRQLGRHDPEFFRRVAQLGRQIAEAVDYAHSRGVLHRDIKPSNLLLDRQGRVWISDFGLAKMDDEDLTRTGDIVGSLRYMAPERFHGECSAKSDIYAIGATLYELLTLQPAYGGGERAQLIRQITTTSPPPPRTLVPAIPLDLETIVVKAIDKDVAGRYQTARALADDLTAFLDHRPISVRPWTPREKFLKWCRRNPTVAALTGTLATVVIVALITTSWLAWPAHRNFQNAEFHRGQAERNAVEIGQRAEETELYLQKAREAIDRMLVQVGSEQLNVLPMITEVRREVLEEALDLYQVLNRQPQNHAELKLDVARTRGTLAFIHFLLANNDEAGDHYQAALAQFAEHIHATSPATDWQPYAKCLYDYARLLDIQHRYQDASDYFRRSLDVYDQFDPQAERVTTLEQTARCYLGMAHIHAWNNRYDEALTSLDQAQPLTTRLHEQHPQDMGYRFDLARIQLQRGNVLFHMQRYAEARESLEPSQQLGNDLAATFPLIPAYREHQILVANNLASVLTAQQDYENAHQVATEGIAQGEELVQRNPQVSGYRTTLLTGLNGLGQLQLIRRDFAGARQTLEQARVHADRLRDESPEYPLAQAQAARLYLRLGFVLRLQKDLPAAVEHLRSAETILRQLVANYPEVTLYRTELAIAQFDLANASVDQGDWESAAQFAATAVENQQRLVDVGITTAARHLRSYLNLLGKAQYQTDRYRATRETARRLAEVAGPQLDYRYAAATLVARCVPSIAHDDQLDLAEQELLIEQYATEAVQMLSDLADTDFPRGQLYEHASMKNDHFEPLRQRSDFQELMARLAADE